VPVSGVTSLCRHLFISYDSGITSPTKLVILLEMAENLSHKNVIKNSISGVQKSLCRWEGNMIKACLQNQVDTVTCILTLYIYQLRAIQEHPIIDTFVLTSVNLWYFLSSTLCMDYSQCLVPYG
jgi:hypothetical protein